ncbi:MAG: DUF572 domain-containing protein [Proteobacteria bacterium]|nr:DUF572 domain-containing protein [Pseudomonadota bacterium]
MLAFFKSNKKKFEVNCPVCRKEFSIKFDPQEITNYDYEYKEGAGFVFSLECDYCDAEASIVQFRSGEVDTFDNKWVKLEKEHSDEISQVRSEIRSMKELLEKNPDNKLKSQLADLEVKLKKLESIFSIQVKKYTDFQAEWRDKWRNEVLNN